jgi:putative FmdB family regulatory protein
MPTYEYECKSCGHNFEVFQAMSDEPLKTCVKCGKEVRRLIFGGAGVIFKGSGFYVTDKGKGTNKVTGTNKAAKTAPAPAPAAAGVGKAAKPESKTADTSGATQGPSAAQTA